MNAKFIKDESSVFKYTFFNYFLLIVLSLQINVYNFAANTNISQQFELRFKAWQDYFGFQDKPTNEGKFTVDHTSKTSSIASDYVNVDVFQKIVDLGVPALPFIVERMKKIPNNQKSYISYAFSSISKTNFHDRKWGRTPFYDRIIEWWENERKNLRTEFEARYEKWRNVPQSERKKGPYLSDWYRGFYDNPEEYEKAYAKWKSMPEGKEKERLRPLAKTEYQQVLDLGVGVLPFAMEKIASGDHELIDAVHYWTNDQIRTLATEKGIAGDAMPAFILNWWNENQENWLLPD
ncbi:MAG: hypothetical protein C4527_12340 [Candidatus Omnitrophota bacterium]|jgi:hypothetical protein|nr:MAG: hypothetical protein C4527_12340 [Candidatus Omnitrophota bacterium]